MGQQQAVPQPPSTGMIGLMMSKQLLLSDIIEHAAKYHPTGEVVSRRVAEGDVHRYTYTDAAVRCRKVANALTKLNLPGGARVGTIAFNGYRHFELYYGVSGCGKVLHTLNPRLSPAQLIDIVNHAEDTVMCFDVPFLPLIKAVMGKCPTIKHFIMLCDEKTLPKDSGIPNLKSYEGWIAQESEQFQWPVFDENSAAVLCYTSGTTGNAKGVVYSHRSSMLHAFASVAPDALNLSQSEVILAIVPLFHVNAWGLPFAGPMTGAKLVFPGAAMDGPSVFELIENEKVSY